MPRTASVAALLRVVEEQSATIRALTSLLGHPAVVSEPRLATSLVVNSEFAQVPVLPSPVERAIRGVADGDDAMRDHLESWALDMLAQDMPPEQVAQAIAQGVQE